MLVWFGDLDFGTFWLISWDPVHIFQTITEVPDHKGGGGAGAMQKYWPEGSQKGNNYTQDKVSIGSSRGDIFNNQF